MEGPLRAPKAAVRQAGVSAAVEATTLAVKVEAFRPVPSRFVVAFQCLAGRFWLSCAKVPSIMRKRSSPCAASGLGNRRASSVLCNPEVGRDANDGDLVCIRRGAGGAVRGEFLSSPICSPRPMAVRKAAMMGMLESSAAWGCRISKARTRALPVRSRLERGLGSSKRFAGDKVLVRPCEQVLDLGPGSAK